MSTVQIGASRKIGNTVSSQTMEAREMRRKRFRIAYVAKQLAANRYLYALFALPFLYYIAFHYLPIYGVLIAFKRIVVFRGLGEIMSAPWIGLKYFKQYLSDPYFWKLARNTVLIRVYGIFLGFPSPIILALLLNELRNDKFKRVIQSITYLPHFISLVVICGMIVNFLSTEGLINRFIGVLGFGPTNFLAKPEWFRTIYVGSDIWQHVGFGSIIYLAALTNIDPQLYEAAAIDGANRWRQLIHVTLPGLAPTITILFILRLGRIMEVGYQKIILLYNGATYETADVISTYVYRRGLIQSDFAYATAVGLFTSLIGLVFVYSANRLARSVGETSLW
jgi:putative aldouronate transport system permease protein